jgi:hypothetical protein
MGRLFSMGYEGLVTVYWWVEFAPWSFVFKGLDRVLVSFPIENFRDAVTLGVARRLCFRFPSDLLTKCHGSCNVLFYMVNTS